MNFTQEDWSPIIYDRFLLYNFKGSTFFLVKIDPHSQKMILCFTDQSIGAFLVLKAIFSTRDRSLSHKDWSSKSRIQLQVRKKLGFHSHSSYQLTFNKFCKKIRNSLNPLPPHVTSFIFTTKNSRFESNPSPPSLYNPSHPKGL